MGSGNWNFLGLGLALTVSALGAGLAMAEPVKVPPEAFAPAALSSKPLTTAGDAVKTPVESPKAAAKPAANPVANPAAKLAAKPRAQPPAKPAVSTAATAGNLPMPPQRPLPSPAASTYAQANVGLRGSLFATHARFKPMVRPVSGPFAIAPTTSTSTADIEQLKRVLEAARKGKGADADAAQRAIADPVARK